MNDPMIGPSIAVIGGGAVGLETAEFLAAKGTLTPEAMHFLFMYEAETVERLRELCTRGTKKVTVFEMLPKAAAEVGRSTRWVLMGSVKRYGIEVITGAKSDLPEGRHGHLRAQRRSRIDAVRRHRERGRLPAGAEGRRRHGKNRHTLSPSSATRKRSAGSTRRSTTGSWR